MAWERGGSAWVGRGIIQKNVQVLDKKTKFNVVDLVFVGHQVIMG